MINRIFTVTTLIVFISTSAISQEIYGLWEVKNVDVGEDNTTPMAKWFRINQNQTFESGNGWLQNSRGTYYYDAKKSTFLPNDPRGIKDEFGAFKVAFKKGKMIWVREEEGMDVKITLEPVISIPESPADLALGLWQQSEYIVNMASKISDNESEKKAHIYIRWDREFIRWDESGNKSRGYWHMNGHRPVITFLPQDETKQANSWNIEVDDEKLILKSSDGESVSTEIVFIRVDEFPNSN